MQINNTTLSSVRDGSELIPEQTVISVEHETNH